MPVGRGFPCGHPEVLSAADFPNKGVDIKLEDAKKYFGIFSHTFF